jgi:hypothetical protein
MTSNIATHRAPKASEPRDGELVYAAVAIVSVLLVVIRLALAW